MLLDEPTNHLDVKNVAWLQDYLNSLPDVTSMVGALLLQELIRAPVYAQHAQGMFIHRCNTINPLAQLWSGPLDVRKEILVVAPAPSAAMRSFGPAPQAVLTSGVDSFALRWCRTTLASWTLSAPTSSTMKPASSGTTRQAADPF